MPTVPRRGKRALYVELPEDLDTQLRDHCRAGGYGVADEVRMAIRRHLAHPPDRSPSPLPPEIGPARASGGTTSSD